MNWNIKGCGDNCLKCNKEFKDGSTFNCMLILKAEGPHREDYCTDCWETIKSNDFGKEFSFWQGRFKLEPEPVEEKIEEPLLKRLLKKWIDSPERLHKCFCYIIALMLERSKTFRIQSSIKNPDGLKQLVYEDKENGETYILEDPGLTIKELDEIEAELQQMLKLELDAK